MDFEGIMPENEISDTEKDKYCLILLICVCVCVCVCVSCLVMSDSLPPCGL